MIELTPSEIAFINRYQGGFPLVERPFLQMAKEFGMDEARMIGMIDELLAKGALSRFGPSYDASRLSGGLTLAAMSVPERRYKMVSNIVNAMTAVAHNYRRDHRLNMWFVVSTLDQGGVEHCLEEIGQLTGLRVYNFPKQREFFLGLWLEIGDNGEITTVPAPYMPASDSGDALDRFDRDLISETQEGIRLIPRPFDLLAERLGATPERVMERVRHMLDSGSIRRIGAIPNHYRLGLNGNGMTVWDIPDEKVEEVGELIGGLDYVSHCYERVRYPDVWPYNLFAMVHGRDRTEAAEKAEQIARLLGDRSRGHDILYSSAVLKKSGLRVAA